MGDYKTITKNFEREGFEDNKTVFGRILQGKLPAKIVFEDEKVLVFWDISPASKYHYLVIPKKFIKRIDTVKPEDEELIRYMTEVAERVAQAHGIENVAEARESGELAIGYHKWPLIMINHLHLHVVFPLPAKSLFKRMMFPKGYGPLFWSPEKCYKEYFSSI